MRKVRIEHKEYVLKKDERRYYDFYWYKKKFYEHVPVDAYVVGYVEQDGTYVGVCKKSLASLTPVLYTGIGILSVSVIAMGIFVFTRKYDVVKWDRFASGDDVIGVLDDGVKEVSRKFTYSQFATYDGQTVSIFYDIKESGVEVSLNVDGRETPFTSAETGYKIPVDLDLEEEDVVEAVLLVRKDSKTEEYPLIIERLIVTEPIQLAFGDEEDRIEAERLITDQIIQQGHYEEPTEVKSGRQSGNMNVSALTDENVRVDFENFDVIPGRKQTNIVDEEYVNDGD